MLDSTRENSFTAVRVNGLFKTDGEAAEVEMEKTESAINNGEGMKVSPLLPQRGARDEPRDKCSCRGK